MALRHSELPLLGSNQDSPDPESEETSLSAVTYECGVDGAVPEPRPKSPHTSPDPSPDTSPLPVRAEAQP